MAKEKLKKADAERLLWAGYAWGSYINMSKDDMAAVADLDFAKALFERSVELDPTQHLRCGPTIPRRRERTSHGGGS
ncbi:MAG: TRAP transporter TatT component family protein [Polyangiales bacterium]